MINTLIYDCEGIIYSIANRYKDNYNIEDLYQVGCIGVIKAAKNFNKYLNVKFTTYAYNYILGEIIDFIKKDRNIVVSDDYFNIYNRYKKVKDLLYSKYQREPLFSEICEFMHIDDKTLINIIERTAFTKNIDDENNIPFDTNIIEKLALDEEIDKLEEPGKSIIKYKYFYGMTQSEIAEMLHLSQSKISRVEKDSLKLMKKKIV